MENHVKNSYARDYARSYKPYTTRRTNHQPPKEPTDYRETILVQFIVCAVMMGCVLVISLAKVPATENLKANLKSALNQTTTSADLAAMWAGVGGLGEQVQGVFSGDEALVGTVLQPAEITEMPTEIAPVPVADAPFRIDEDILTQINSQQDFYNKTRVVNQEVAKEGDAKKPLGDN